MLGRVIDFREERKAETDRSGTRLMT
jgi:hypothetical protein